MYAARSVAKPPHVFDREREWSGLTGFAASPSTDVRLGIVSGRRRQGKTYLLDALVSELGGFFFAAIDATEAESLERFGRALGAYAGGGRFALTSWEDALAQLFTVVKEGLIVIDEFPYLVKASPELPSLLQHALDPRGIARAGRSRLLLCGSAMAVMGRLLSGTAPLRGRASLELVVRPLDYRDAASFWDIDDPQLAVLVHAIVGGTPAYRREFVGGDSPASLEDFDAWVLRTVLNPQVPLFREARYLLAEEGGIRDPAGYHAVLGAIAGGHTTRGGIANHIGRPSTDIGHPLSVLEDAQLISRTSDPFRRGSVVYQIEEPLLVFHEAVIRREWTRLDRGDAEGAWANSQATFSAQVVGPHFERICREWAVRQDEAVFGALPGDVVPTAVNDPAARSQIQVDVAVLAPEASGGYRRVLSLGEAKWQQTMSLSHVRRLERARDLLMAKGVDASDAVLACYSGAGFDDDLRRAAEGDPGLRLVHVDDLYA